MRLFAALVPPAEVLDEVERAVAPHAGQVPGLRWPARETWHLTMAFYGDVPDRAVPDLEARLSRAAARHPAPSLAFAGFGAFSSVRRARVLWAGVQGDPLTRLADSARAAGQRAGAVQTDAKRFHPHLTLARAKTDLDLSELVRELDGFAGTPWRAEELHLVRSHLGAQVRYERIGTWALG